jgi:hypothetical protein
MGVNPKYWVAARSFGISFEIGSGENEQHRIYGLYEHPFGVINKATSFGRGGGDPLRSPFSAGLISWFRSPISESKPCLSLAQTENAWLSILGLRFRYFSEPLQSTTKSRQGGPVILSIFYFTMACCLFLRLRQ